MTLRGSDKMGSSRSGNRRRLSVNGTRQMINLTTDLHSSEPGVSASSGPLPRARALHSMQWSSVARAVATSHGIRKSCLRSYENCYREEQGVSHRACVHMDTRPDCLESLVRLENETARTVHEPQYPSPCQRKRRERPIGLRNS